MRTIIAFAVFLTLVTGCTREPDVWYTESLVLTDVQTLTVFDGCYTLDGGTTTLFALTETGDRCVIRLNQHAMGGYDNPGRLFFNAAMIDVRSPRENLVLDLLRSATIELDDKYESESNTPTRDADIVLGDDISLVLSQTPLENLQSFRNQILSYVESDLYVQIANNGL